MSGPNLLTPALDLKSVLDLVKKDIFLSLNCHAIAEVQIFDPVNQTVQASMNYRKTSYSSDGLGIPLYSDYPVLVDCPVVVLGGGLANITFPISSGDDCLIFFNDRDIDNWFQAGTVGPLNSSRLHSFSDAIALVGVNSLVDSLPTVDLTRAVFSYGDTNVSVGLTKVRIENSITTLGTQIQNVLSALVTMTTSMSAASDPTVATAAATAAAALTTYQTLLAGLLE